MSESTSQAAPAADEAEYNEEYLVVPGIRFVPTEKELIVHYLRRKLRGEPLPTDLVLDGHDAYAEHPKKLVPKLGEATEGAWYLFSPRDRKYAGGMRPKRDTGDDEGHWKAVEAEKEVLGGADGKEVVGTKRALTFHEHLYQVDALGKRKRVKNKSKPTRWKMVEFVSSNSTKAARNDAAPDPMLLNDFVLCKITNRSPRAVKVKRGKEEENGDANGEEEPRPEGGGEEKRLPEEQPGGGGGAGAQGEQQPPPSGGGAGSPGGNQQPAAAGAPSGGHTAALPGDGYRVAQYFAGVGGSNPSGTNMLSVFDSGDLIGTAYGGGEPVDAKRGGAPASSSNQRQKLRTGEVRPHKKPRPAIMIGHCGMQFRGTGNFVNCDTPFASADFACGTFR